MFHFEGTFSVSSTYKKKNHITCANFSLKKDRLINNRTKFKLDTTSMTLFSTLFSCFRRQQHSGRAFCIPLTRSTCSYIHTHIYKMNIPASSWASCSVNRSFPLFVALSRRFASIFIKSRYEVHMGHRQNDKTVEISEQKQSR